ncbi:hypothetical protein AZO1586R_776 [Bathymodiolus azoricus thioautotrophic gill symbiont]|uniref:Uncharacterized protein n=2 Tax=Bathymodiolus azoricus thioautotrophic gill symbiont TaxID=235205 RepID=A0ACA8ZPS2_9GAMM|nr:hypothetical protein [Bathymodiolus azoricus thioautotrophic gill symbiont]CAB5498507.1 hypothetical protein AZO1586R_776 [Bathymodiolus azoricus thioautotrophic gill symbiont]
MSNVTEAQETKETQETQGSVNQFGEEPKSKSSNKKVFIGVISVFVVIVLVSVVFFFTQQQDSVVVARFQDVLGSNLEKPKNDDTKSKNKTITKTETKTETKTKTENKSASIKINPSVVKQNERSKFENKNANIKINPSVVKQNDQSKFKEEIKKILKKALISAHKNGKYEVAELTKKNQQSFDEFKNSLIKSQESNNHKILSKVNRAQETTFNKISALFESKKQKIKESRSANEVFELLGISLWDSKPQATIRYQGKTSIVGINSIRIGWKVIDIDFDKEKIMIVKNGQKHTLEKIK